MTGEEAAPAAAPSLGRKGRRSPGRTRREDRGFSEAGCHPFRKVRVAEEKGEYPPADVSAPLRRTPCQGLAAAPRSLR